MKDASQYPITTPYGQVPGYPLNNGFHRGEDRAMPVGTPVLVNGAQIGLSGSTGASTGPHLHIGKWVNGVVQPPSGAGFALANASVYDTGYDAENGNFVRVSSDGALFVYLHLSAISVTKGQILKGKDMDIADHDFVADVCVGMCDLQPEVNQNFMNNIGLPKSQVVKNFLNYTESRNLRLDAEAYRAGQTASGFSPYAGSQLYVKK